MFGRTRVRRMALALLCVASGSAAFADQPSPWTDGLIESDRSVPVVRAAARLQSPAPVQTPPTEEALEEEGGAGLGERPELELGGQPGEDDDAETLESLSERLREMEERWSELDEAEEEAAAAAAKKSSWGMTGRIHLDYWNFADDSQGVNYLENRDPAADDFGTDPEDRWAFRRVRLEFYGEVPANMLFRLQIDFNEPSEPEYKDVYIGWQDLPNNHMLLLGNQKRPIGLDHLNSSRFNVFAERPMAVEAFNEDARRIGLCMYGYNDAETVNWQYGIFSLENTAVTGRLIGDSMQMGGYGRLVLVPWYDEISGGRGYQHLGFAGSVARPDGDATDADSNENEARFRTRPEARSDARWLDTGRIAGAEWFEQVGFESITNIGSLQVTGEYLATFLQRDPVAGPADDLAFHGGYIYASYFLTGEFIPYDRQSGTIERVVPHENFFLVDRCRGGTGKGWGAWQVAARYSYLDLTDSNIEGGIGHNVTFGLNWHWTPYSKVQTNLVLGTIDSREPVFDPVLGETFSGGDYAIFGSRFMLDW
ncbi:OprO/OprP family phosphate-selective porin [Candidatus Laterigemmans baculatus]|uniref:OprO/OprP family phosphate-selective porin n=1 Tax=Candidatus Laterigemmans baculatus TaxID=2770505 RepID=UPI0013DCCA94|nr:porin [Candidatus Laterigemmans baculatus]